MNYRVKCLDCGHEIQRDELHLHEGHDVVNTKSKEEVEKIKKLKEALDDLEGLPIPYNIIKRQLIPLRDFCIQIIEESDKMNETEQDDEARDIHDVAPLVHCRRCGQETIEDGIMIPCCSNPDTVPVNEEEE